MGVTAPNSVFQGDNSLQGHEVPFGFVAQMLENLRTQQILLPFTRRLNFPGNSVVASVPVSGSLVSNIGAEGVDAVEQKLSSTKIDIGKGKREVYVPITDEAQIYTDETPGHVMQEMSEALAEDIDKDIAATFGTFTNSVGTSGAAMTPADLIDAAFILDTNSIRGQRMAIISFKQKMELQKYILTNTSSIYSNTGTSQSALLDEVQPAVAVGRIGNMPIYVSGNIADDGTDFQSVVLAGNDGVAFVTPSKLTGFLSAERTRGDLGVRADVTYYKVRAHYGTSKLRDEAGVQINTGI